MWKDESWNSQDSSARLLSNSNYTSRWSGAEPEYDRGVVIGLAVAGLLLLLGVFLGGRDYPLASPISLLLVLGGTIGATLINFSLKDLQSAVQKAITTIYLQISDPRSRILYLVQLAHRVRKEGLLVLEQDAQKQDDGFLKVALELAVDCPESDDLRRTLEIEVQSTLNRSLRPIQVFETMGTYAPALGLIGTLIGLIQMLGSLSDPTTVGPAMGVALITTLYGAILANMIFLPIAGKLKIRAEEEALVKTLTIEGIIAITRQENPLVVEQKLQTFVPMQAAI